MAKRYIFTFIRTSQDKKWEKTYELRAHKLFEKLATHKSPKLFLEFSRDMRDVQNIKGTDFKLWKLERADCALSKREEYSDLRLNTVSVDREKLLKLLRSHPGHKIGTVRTLYGKRVRLSDDFVPIFKKSKKK